MTTKSYKSYKRVYDRRIILIASFICALLILLSGIFAMTLIHAARENPNIAQTDSSSFTENTDTILLPENAGSRTESDSDQVHSDNTNPQMDSTLSAKPEAVKTTPISADSQNSINNPNQKKKDDKIVPKSKKQNASYLDDAVFIGDSVTVSLSLYQALPAKNVVATQNISIWQVISGKEVFATAKGKVSLEKALSGKDPKKIYIMLGANGMGGWTNKQQIEYYSTLLDQLEKWYPDAVIYVESMSPVTASRNKTDKKNNNKNIDDFNKRLLKMVQGRTGNIYYLNVAETLKTRYGNLKSKYDGGDGLHFSPAAAKEVVDYALRHTVR